MIVRATPNQDREAGMDIAPVAPSLDALAAEVRRDLGLLDHPADDWVPPRSHPTGAPVHDVVVVGGGQGALATLFGLARDHVTNTVAFDRAPRGREGPWTTFARMRTLRTHKNITGPALGVPSLTPRAWYTARYGADAWDALVRIPRTDWQAYLDWYRQVLRLPVVNETEVGPLEPEHPGRADSLIRVPLRATGPSGRNGAVYAREVVLANGIDGCGSWTIPEIVSRNLPPARYAGAHDDIDFAALAGRRVIVLGANAGGFDNAAVALEAGAREAHLLVRRRRIPKVNAHRPLDSAGYLKHFAALDADTRWRLMVHVMRNNQPPPQETFDRAAALPGFVMHENAGLESLFLDGDEIVASTAGGEEVRAEFLIAATGFSMDFARRIETSAIASHIALWRDRYAPPAGLDDWEPMSAYPWLGEGFEFTERKPGSAPWLRHIHCFNIGTMPSLGATGSSATSMRYGAARLIDALTRQLFIDDADHHAHMLETFGEPDLDTRGLDAGEGSGDSEDAA